MIMIYFSTATYTRNMDVVASNRKHKIHKFMVGTWPIICLFTPDEIEKLLRSNVLIEKSNEYDFLHCWLGLGLLTR